VFIIAAIAMVPAMMLSSGKHSDMRYFAALGAGFLLSIGFSNNYFAETNREPFDLMYAKGATSQDPLFERWNSFSRVSVYPYQSATGSIPYGWGFGPGALKTDQLIGQRTLLIDSATGTVLTNFIGDLQEVEYLKSDIINLPHHLRSDASVMVIGIGGGRDILSSFVFDQKQITAAEINDTIIDVLTTEFADYVGNIATDPRVTIVNDEARSYLSRSDQMFDIIQISLIDTWAATAAGAFVLTENTLYTKETWQLFLDRLQPNGVLSVSRWYFADQPGEVYRLATLAAESLRSKGIITPRDHTMIYRTTERADLPGEIPDGVGPLWVSREPFSPDDMSRMASTAATYGFEMVLTPHTTNDDTYLALVGSTTPSAFLTTYPINISAPTDNSPFFFHMLWPRDFLNPLAWDLGLNSFNMRAVATLMILLAITVIFAAVFIILPLVFKLRHAFTINVLPFMVYFTAIGVGFMLIEIALLQRLSVFLGHPVYSLVVVLTSLLLAGGVGSYLTSRLSDSWLTVRTPHYLLGVVILLTLVVPTMIYLSTALMGLDQVGRIIVTTLFVMMVGVSLGVAFPLGMRMAERYVPEFTPFLWGINGATSVVASVLVVVISLVGGIAMAMIVGIVAYVCAPCAAFAVRYLR